MLHTDYLTRHLQHLADVTGAASIAVYAPVPWKDGTPLLAHFGPEAPVPELASLEAAEAFAGRAVGGGVGGWAIEGVSGAIPSESGDGLLLQVPLLSTLWSGGAAVLEATQAGPRRRQSDQRSSFAPCGWVGIRLEGNVAPDRLDTLGRAAPLARALAAAIVGLHAALTDPLTGVPGRHELDVLLSADLQLARRHRLPCGLVLVNPLGLDQINAQHGRQAGDMVLREVVQALRVLVRGTDAVMRYGAAIFALPLGTITEEHTAIVAERVRADIADRTFLNEAVRLECAVGAVSCEERDVDGVEPIDLLRRATEALGVARGLGGKSIVMWRESADTPAASPDRLFGIFTGRADKDYRNMGLLWDVLQVLSRAQGTTDMARLVVERLAMLLRCERTGLFVTGDPAPRLLAGRRRDESNGSWDALGDEEVTEDERALVADAVSATVPREGLFSVGNGHLRGIAVPLVTGDRTIGAICLAGNSEALGLDKTDLSVLTGVAAQLAMALDREHLVEAHRARAEQERRRLQTEVQDLRSALQQGPLVFQSSAMTQLLDRVRRVAATDTTVLVTGESGTGKEMLAQALHRLSGRRTKPFVIVDCGAMPATLIDSELFGHERGAFTGAGHRKTGRLAQADGGTVFLDEVGELPLDVQSRLLRFVQEKTISSVGGTSTRKIDVRIVAATNRPLEDEVRAGRFREDLFYRLNVVRLHVPPLRERPEDVSLLARHFARVHAAEQGKALAGFSDEAERCLTGYTWPGNVRELQNTVLQAVVLAEHEELQVTDLMLAPANVRPANLPTAVVPRERPVIAGAASTPAARSDTTFEHAWTAFGEALAALVRDAAAARPRRAWPLGRWLTTDLTLAVHASVGEVRPDAARRLGLPPTTFARRLQKAIAERMSAPALPSWSTVRDAIERVAAACETDRTGLAHDAEALLLEIVAEHAAAPLSFSAALMDWSTPTMKRRLAARGQHDAAVAPALTSGAAG